MYIFCSEIHISPQTYCIYTFNFKFCFPLFVFASVDRINIVFKIIHVKRQKGRDLKWEVFQMSVNRFDMRKSPLITGPKSSILLYSELLFFYGPLLWTDAKKKLSTQSINFLN